MVDMRPLIVLTGTLHVEGGLAKTTRSKSKQRGGNKLTVTESREVSPDRRRGNVVVTDVMRRIRQIRIIRTPFGTLVAPDQLEALKAVIAEATKDVSSFNTSATKVRLANTLLWEHLKGNRLDAIRVYVEKAVREGDEEVKAALPMLISSSRVAA